MKSQSLIIGLVGEIVAGKSTAAAYLARRYQAQVSRFSDPLRQVLGRLYLSQSRDHLRRLSLSLRQTFGEDTLAKTVFQDLRRSSTSLIVVDGIRRPADLTYLRPLSGFKLVYIEASLENRYQRILVRRENDDDGSKTFEQFKNDHQLETEMQITGFRSLADTVVENNTSLADFERQLDRYIMILR